MRHMATKHPYIAINASAGSGKTYTLVQRILVLCLSKPHQHDAIQHILALTFTNKAANEMKARILDWLKAFTKADYEQNQELQNIQTELKSLGINVTLTELHQRSQKVLDYILHHYSTLNISTIDKFNSKLVRNFSYELGLPHQFSIEINNEPFLLEAVDRVLFEIGEENPISDAFMDLVEYNLENDERANISKTLYHKAKNLTNDVHYTELQKNKDFNWGAYDAYKTKIRARIVALKNENLRIAEVALEAIQKAGVSIDDFHSKGNGLGAFFQAYKAYAAGSREFPFPTNEEKKLETFRKGSASKDISIQHSVGALVDPLIDFRAQIIRNYIEQIKAEKILKELLPFKFNKEIQDQLQLIEEENDLVLLSKFNILINENLKNEPSDFIYEKIGTRFQHFFIDEFQDTSQMQWNNIVPLKDNTVATENSSFTLVGDPKQSIYRFRGGDSEIMLNILNGKEDDLMPAHIENLSNNWRSSKNIVDFNNELYQFISKGLKPEHQNLFGVLGIQNSVKKNFGRVKVHVSEYDRKADPFFENAAQQMHDDIQECINNGFSFSDITIICRKSKEIKKFSSLLGQKAVHYQGKDQKIRCISERGLTLDISITLKALIEFLRWKLEPANLQYATRFLYYLNELGRISMVDFSEELVQLLESKNPTHVQELIAKNYNLKLDLGDSPQLNLYNYIEYFLQEFSVPTLETDYLMNFLEVVFGFTQNAGATLKDFIQFWDEEAKDISVQASENIDAVTMMTIHAAKGLEFPIVFLPITNDHKDSKFSNWFSLEEEDALQTINLSNFESVLATYDNEIREFNEQNSYKNTIDRLCVNYVATTRPVEQLFLYLQKPSENGKPNEILEFIQQKAGAGDTDSSFDLYPIDADGLKKQTKDLVEKHNTWQIERLSSNTNHLDNIRIATPSKNYQKTVRHVKEGIFVHEILSKIKYPEDVDRVVTNYILNGIFSSEESTRISDKIKSILNHPEYSSYFSKENTVYTEKDLMISKENQTQIFRPDRLIETPQGWIIVDYKTGEENLEKHEAQLMQYQEILEKMGKTVIEKKIIYIR